MTKQEIDKVNDLLTNYNWPKGSPQLAMLKGLASTPQRKLHKKDRRVLSWIENKAKGLERQQVRVEAKRNKNHKRHARQLEAIKAGR